MARVLVIDPDATIRELLTSCLEDEGYVVRAAGGLADALRLLRTGQFDLILADLFRIATRSESHSPSQALMDAAPDVPLVLCTTLPDAADLEFWHHGLAGVILKPFAIDDLYSCLAQVLVDGSHACMRLASVVPSGGSYLHGEV